MPDPGMVGVRLNGACSLILYLEAESVLEEPWRLTSSGGQAPGASIAMKSVTAGFGMTLPEGLYSETGTCRESYPKVDATVGGKRDERRV